MDKVLILLIERNKYIQKLYEVNHKEINRITANCFDHVEEFYKIRGHLLDIIQNLEEMLDQALKTTHLPVTKRIKSKIQNILEEKDKTVKKILQQDLEILSIIEQRKTQMIQKLQVLNDEDKTTLSPERRRAREGA